MHFRVNRAGPKREQFFENVVDRATFSRLLITFLSYLYNVMYNMQLHYDNRYVQRIQNWQHCQGILPSFSRVFLNFLTEEVPFKLFINQCVYRMFQS